MPSIGSTIHCRPVKVVDPPNSSPKTPSPGLRGLAHVGFDRPIGVGHRRQIRFGVDAQIERPEPDPRQFVRTVGQSQRKH
ncbi:hypothetical protein J113_21855 [Mycobacterium tuberculosis CAS/NITR204]|uniref:Uncharacterized protein n=1 Tax=Mycobacterium tuberculosis CAS/NITR204 TaxID=1310114 RepID=R4MI46_MYCTX|nr:hypothetical protein J113_21855 [Mycobacterium tuberculosis CAS/NITR204]